MQGKEEYRTAIIMPCDVLDTQRQKLEAGVANFWMRAMVNHPGISERVSERDRPILSCLENIVVELQPDGFGFTLSFFFDESVKEFMLERVLKKTFVMSRQNVIEKTEATKINWKDGRDPSRRKQKKKRKGKRVTVDVHCPSFFELFDQMRMPSDDDLKEGKLTFTRKDVEKAIVTGDNDGSDQETEVEDTERAAQNVVEENLGERMDMDYQLSLDIKDELVPLAFEYYLNVVEHGSDFDDDELAELKAANAEGADLFDEKIDGKRANKEDCKQQ